MKWMKNCQGYDFERTRVEVGEGEIGRMKS